MFWFSERSFGFWKTLWFSWSVSTLLEVFLVLWNVFGLVEVVWVFCKCSAFSGSGFLSFGSVLVL